MTKTAIITEIERRTAAAWLGLQNTDYTLAITTFEPDEVNYHELCEYLDGQVNHQKALSAWYELQKLAECIGIDTTTFTDAIAEQDNTKASELHTLMWKRCKRI